jgi:hypothetical protein
VYLRNRPICRDSRLLEITEQIIGADTALYKTCYEEQMLERLGAFDSALSPGQDLFDSLFAPSFAK